MKYEVKYWFCSCYNPQCNITLYYDEDNVSEDGDKILEYTMVYPMYFRNIPLEERLKYHKFFGKYSLNNIIYYGTWRYTLWNIIDNILFKPIDIVKQLVDVLFRDMHLVYDCLPVNGDVDEIKKYDNSLSILTEDHGNYVRKIISSEYPINKSDAGVFLLLRYIFRGFISAKLVRDIENDKIDSDYVYYE